jgi:hypothetical protein
MVIERRVSWGNLLGVIPVILVAGGWVYDRQTDGRLVRSQSAMLVDHNEQLINQGSTLAIHGERLVGLERRADDRQSEVLRRLDRIEDLLNRKADRE